ncbi:Dymeclin [Phycomyces nitens]|nr:Dymeclin [Phycomyces nitens]
MNPYRAQSSPPLPVLTVPNKTLAPLSPLSNLAAKRSAFHLTSPVSPLARSPSIELSSDSFTTIAAQSTIRSSISSTLSRKTDSSFFTPTQTAAIKSLCSPITADASLWSTLLDLNKYPATHSPQDAYDLEMATVGLSIELAANNVSTHNFDSLVLHLLSQLHRWQDSKADIVPTSTYNALFLTRVFSKQFTGNLTNQQVIEQFEGRQHVKKDNDLWSPGHSSQASLTLDVQKLAIHADVETDSRPKGEQLLDSLLSILINTDPNVSYSTYEFYTEVLNILLVLFSTQLHRARLSEPNYFLDLLAEKFSNRSSTIVAKLLENFVEQKSPPSQTSSVVYSAYNYFFSRSGLSSDADAFPVADRSLLLLLLLGNQEKHYVPISKEGPPVFSSSYRNALSSLRDQNARYSDLESNNSKVHLISFKDLFEIFCRSLGVEERMLLFYLILVENESFRVYVLSRTDPETIVSLIHISNPRLIIYFVWNQYIPILKMIYEAIEGKTNYSQVYVLLIFLLIFSHDDVNNETIQKISVSNLAWFTERPLLKAISLGGLVSLVLIRTLQLNLSHQKDIYFHTNCLAILANMSTSMLDMHAYVAQRIISLFELISKRHQKVVNKSHLSGEALPYNDITVYEDLLSLVLEIINSVLTHRLKYNTQLVYALLLKREIFVPFRLHARLSESINNIEQVINFFHARVEEANLKAPSSVEVLDLIAQSARTWSPNRLTVLPDLKFQYEEEQDAHEFFVPYVWALIHRRTFIYWSEEKAHVLNEYRQLNDSSEDLDLPAERER